MTLSIGDPYARRVADPRLSSMTTATALTFLTTFCSSNPEYHDKLQAAIIKHRLAMVVRPFQIV